MTLANPHAEPKVTSELIAEAAAWIAVLHGPNRTAATERGFAQWIKKSASHARAFEEATGIWEEARSIPRAQPLQSLIRRRSRSRVGFFKPAIAAALVLIAVAVTSYYQHRAGLSTKVGEQRILALDDGTRVILNTDTRVVVSYDREARRVELKEGEAIFEVARNPKWPFVVDAGDRRIQALGTSFAVRRDHSQLAVTLVEGKVAVSERPALESPVSASASSDSTAMILTPGERVVFADHRSVKMDRPPLDKLLAWQRREVVFDNTALADAVTEMNRYNRKPLQIATDVAAVRVTGLFRAGDSLSFARAVAEAYRLDINESDDRIELSGTNAAP